MFDDASGFTRGGRRRLLLAIATGLPAAGLLGVRRLALAGASGAPSGSFEVTHGEAEWRSLLTPEQFVVLRQQGTERAFTSPLDGEKRGGVYSCAGCGHELFSSATKFDSGTGWPSFWRPLAHAVNAARAPMGMFGSEIHCLRCGGHLGHVFDDGPAPTGLRYCINGVALKFAAS